MPPLGTPMIDVSVPAQFPREMSLPVHLDTSGRAWPGAGTIWQKQLSARQLIALGIDLLWVLPDGTPLSREDALALIDANEALVARGHQPQFPSAPTEE